jgi:hypothetical protein
MKSSSQINRMMKTSFLRKETRIQKIKRNWSWRIDNQFFRKIQSANIKKTIICYKKTANKTYTHWYRDKRKAITNYDRLERNKEFYDNAIR